MWSWKIKKSLIKPLIAEKNERDQWRGKGEGGGGVKR